MSERQTISFSHTKDDKKNNALITQDILFFFPLSSSFLPISNSTNPLIKQKRSLMMMCCFQDHIRIVINTKTRQKRRLLSLLLTTHRLTNMLVILFSLIWQREKSFVVSFYLSVFTCFVILISLSSLSRSFHPHFHYPSLFLFDGF
jgi:hypothetical protein